MFFLTVINSDTILPPFQTNQIIFSVFFLKSSHYTISYRNLIDISSFCNFTLKSSKMGAVQKTLLLFREIALHSDILVTERWTFSYNFWRVLLSLCTHNPIFVQKRWQIHQKIGCFCLTLHPDSVILKVSEYRSHRAVGPQLLIINEKGVSFKWLWIHLLSKK